MYQRYQNRVERGWPETGLTWIIAATLLRTPPVGKRHSRPLLTVIAAKAGIHRSEFDAVDQVR